MNKKLIALAIAGAMAAPLAAQAEVAVYGLAHVSVDAIDGADNNPGYVVASRASRVGVKGAEDLGGGLKAIFQMEWQVDMADASGSVGNCTSTVTPPATVNTSCGNGNLASRNQVVGLSGGWGTLVAGRHDTPYKMSTGKLDVFGDTVADYNVIISMDVRADNAIAYLSPSFNGFNVNAAIVTDEASGNLGGTTDDPAATSIAATYGNGPLFLALANETVSNANADHTRFGAGYGMGAFNVGFVYETLEDTYDAWLLNGAFDMGGGNSIKAAYGSKDWDASGVDDTTQASIGFDHAFSKATSAYAIYTTVENGTVYGTSGIGTDSSGDQSAFSVGMVHKF